MEWEKILWVGDVCVYVCIMEDKGGIGMGMGMVYWEWGCPRGLGWIGACWEARLGGAQGQKSG